MSPFDFLNSINDSKKDLIREDPLCEKDYAAYIVNKSLSYFYDTVFLANEMNKHHHLSKKYQYDFLLNAVSKKKRFSKWHKADKYDDVELISKEYGYSKNKALEVLSLFKEDELQKLKNKYNTGGR